MSGPILIPTERGLYCEAGDFYIDPWRPVDRAVITHAHSDHARWGMGQYLCADIGESILRQRVGDDANVQTLAYGERLTINDVTVSLHPAGHILGSSQVRIERRGEVAVVSGDYKAEADATCAAFEPIRCHLFVTECTFGLPIYRWRPQREVFAEINQWWRQNQEQGRASLLLGYSLGKAQRALSGLDPSLGPIFEHGAAAPMTEAYRRAGVQLPPTYRVGEASSATVWSKALILAPPSAEGTPWTRRFGEYSNAFLSGWMAIRGTRRRRGVDRGFVMSDHVDWPSLLDAIGATGAERIWATHGYTASLVRYLREKGIHAEELRTAWTGEVAEEDGKETPS